MCVVATVQLLGSRTFCVTMTDDSAAEREAVLKTWPETQLLLCQFHVNQAVWRWLQQGRVRISDFSVTITKTMLKLK